MAVRRGASFLGVALLLALFIPSGCNDDACTATCKLVAQCKEDKNKSPERVLGERAPPPNRRCMDRCENNPEAWKQCEGRRRTCEGLRGCLGPDFND